MVLCLGMDKEPNENLRVGIKELLRFLESIGGKFLAQVAEETRRCSAGPHTNKEGLSWLKTSH